MHFIALASVAAVAVSGVSAINIPHSHYARGGKPSTYNEAQLEPYVTYHTRYMAIHCETQHNTAFFDDCCHPMLKTETLSKNRKSYCDPAKQPPSTTDDDDCDEDEPTPTPTPPTGDDDEDCSDEEDEPASSVAQPAATTAKPASTSKAASSTSTKPASTAKPSSTTTKQSSTTTKQSTTTPKSSSSTSSKPQSTSTADFTGGHATFFYQNGVAGACGTVHSDNALIIALQTQRYGNLNAQSPNCGRQIQLTNTNNGKSVTVVVADACPSCGHENDLDLSVAAFKKIANLDEGYVPIKWHFTS